MDNSTHVLCPQKLGIEENKERERETERAREKNVINGYVTVAYFHALLTLVKEQSYIIVFLSKSLEYLHKTGTYIRW